MTLSLLPWLVAALLALLGGVADLLLTSRLQAAAHRTLRLALAAVIGASILAGAGWLAAESAAWSGVPLALVYLAFGALLGAAALVSRPSALSQAAVFGLTLIAVAMAAAVAVLVATEGNNLPAGPAARSLTLAARTALAGIGSGVWLPVAVASMLFAARTALREGQATASELPQSGRTVDPGRLPAVIGYPVLTVALIAAMLWNVQAYAAAWRTALPDLWLLVTWLLGAAYLHATSPWRPLGLPAWFPSLVAAGACGASVLAALSAGALLV
jgi:ABC-type transport system involved in cytochrome c biogenesis permease subunit